MRGDVVGDASYFRGELFGLGWQWNDLQWYFGAEPSALSIDENSVEVTMSPASKKGEQRQRGRQSEPEFVSTHQQRDHRRTRTRSPRSELFAILSDNNVRVWGDFPVGGRAFSAFLSVHDPPMWAATLFKQALIARGIKVNGEPRSRDFRVAEADKFDPQKAVELAHANSQSLAEIVRRTNKESNNLFAELLLRTVGKDRGCFCAGS